MGRTPVRKITVALAGNPNVGKSTLFNALTGLRQHTGNWPGKTVSIAQGKHKKRDMEFHFVDLPGTYSFEGASRDEQIAAEFIKEDRADCVVAVCDATCLERSLILVLQILAHTGRVVVCVNLVDEARARGLEIDAAALSEYLGVPVVLTAASRKQGLQSLLEQIEYATGFVGRSLIQPDWDYIEKAQFIAQNCVRQTEGASQQWRRELDRFLVGRRHGFGVMLGLFLVIIWLTVWGANYPSRLLERLFEVGYGVLVSLLDFAPEWFKGMLCDGLYATSARVISVMLPPMAIFFTLFTVLEDVGYLPRMAFFLDHGMCRCGGCGKQALPLCMGLGCNAVGVMGCRIIDSPRERLAAILTNAMVPCNGRFPALIVLGSLFFPGAYGALLVAACVVLGMAGAMAASGVLSKTALKGKPSTFLMEMPPFRRPRLGQILVRSLLDRTVYVAGRALCVAAPAGVILWILANTRLLPVLAAFLDPVGMLLGMNGVILVGFILSLPANELLIPVILMALSGSGSLQSMTGVEQILLTDGGLTWQMALCTMVFTVFHWPCSTTLMTVYRETGSMKKTAAAFLLPTAVGCVLCMILQFIL